VQAFPISRTTAARMLQCDHLFPVTLLTRSAKTRPEHHTLLSPPARPDPSLLTTSRGTP
jgi:hypothetical protein